MSPWFVGLALTSSSVVLMGALVAVAAVGLVWVATGGAEGEAVRASQSADAAVDDASGINRSR